MESIKKIERLLYIIDQLDLKAETNSLSLTGVRQVGRQQKLAPTVQSNAQTLLGV
jgi:hypothetical protein